MNLTLLKALVALLPAVLLLAASATLFSKAKSVPTFLQLVGAACLTVVVLTHVCEAVRLFPSMGWGRPDSAGHYLDLSSAVLGLTLFPIGYLWHVLRRNVRL